MTKWFSSSHEPMCRTTNVLKSPNLLLENNQNLDGKSITDWFVSDFTLPEIKKLQEASI
jgi:glycerophosphoryl diester phosphodiesterase